MVNSHNTFQEWIPGRFMSACDKKKNIPRKQSSDLVSLKHRTVLESVSMILRSAANRSEFTSDFPLLRVVVIQLNV